MEEAKWVSASVMRARWRSVLLGRGNGGRLTQGGDTTRRPRGILPWAMLFCPCWAGNEKSGDTGYHRLSQSLSAVQQRAATTSATTSKSSMKLCMRSHLPFSLSEIRCGEFLNRRKQRKQRRVLCFLRSPPLAHSRLAPEGLTSIRRRSVSAR